MGDQNFSSRKNYTLLIIPYLCITATTHIRLQQICQKLFRMLIRRHFHNFDIQTIFHKECRYGIGLSLYKILHSKP